jgi:hypothetical protein
MTGGKMKRRMIRILLLLLTAGVFVSCDSFMGEDGKDGQAFIAYSWAVGPIMFYTEDPAFEDREYISNGVYEETEPGTYYFEYIAWDDSYWYGEYTIYINEGTAGGFLTDGIDGEDIYFELACYSFGPSFYEWTEEYAFRPVSARSAASAAYAEAYEAEKDSAPSGGHVQTKAGEAAEKGFVPSGEREYTETRVLESGRYSVVLRYGKRDE